MSQPWTAESVAAMQQGEVAVIINDEIIARQKLRKEVHKLDKEILRLNYELTGISAKERTLNERRAVFVYEGARIAAIAAKAPIVPELWIDREEPFKEQFLKVIEKQTGPDRNTSPKELHEDWVIAYTKMGWVFGEKRDTKEKTHPDMVPYECLGQLEKDKDEVFIALCDIARQWVYEPEPSIGDVRF